LIRLKVGNIYTEIDGNLPSRNLSELSRLMAFRPEGYQFTPQFNRFIHRKDADGRKIRIRIWDGYKRLLLGGKKKKYFPTGLYSIAAEYFKSKNINFITNDLRIKPEKNINLDYADVRSVMSSHGLSVIAVGESKSVDKVNEVVEDTLRNALLDVDIGGATGALIHITGGPELTLGEANAVGELLTERIDPKAQVIWGARVDPTFENKMEVITIFTGVHSPYIRGPAQEAARDYRSNSRGELDIEYVK